MIQLNEKFPSLTWQATGEIQSSDALTGKNIVLYFYPKDHTPGCTQESQDFRDLYAKFNQANTVILGISRDSLTSHEKFKTKHSLPFELISDKDENLCQLFDVIKQKSLFGKKYMGIERSTFVFDANGILLHEWRKVKVSGHAKEVLEKVQAL